MGRAVEELEVIRIVDVIVTMEEVEAYTSQDAELLPGHEVLHGQTIDDVLEYLHATILHIDRTLVKDRILQRHHRANTCTGIERTIRATQIEEGDVVRSEEGVAGVAPAKTSRELQLVLSRQCTIGKAEAITLYSVDEYGYLLISIQIVVLGSSGCSISREVVQPVRGVVVQAVIGEEGVVGKAPVLVDRIVVLSMQLDGLVRQKLIGVGICSGDRLATGEGSLLVSKLVGSTAIDIPWELGLSVVTTELVVADDRREA